MPKWSMPKCRSLPLIESKAIEGERKSTYWCMPAILNSLFSFFSSPSVVFFFIFVLLPFLLNAYFWVMFFFLEIPITVIFQIPLSPPPDHAL